MARLLMGALALFAVACSDPSRPNVELIQDMMESPAIKAQEGNRVPPEGTVAQGHYYYQYKTDPIRAEAELKNIYAGQMNPEILALGQKNFEIYCMVCHGEKGKGDGPVSSKMLLKPPPLVSEKVRNFKDGRIFHIITMGQGVMGSYANQIHKPEARWAVVNYIRSLQKLSE